MAWFFGDSFDLYTTPTDMLANYWDSANNPASSTLVTGRFAGSQGMNLSTNTTFIKNSGNNDAIHHFVISFNQSSAISGTNTGFYIQMMDGLTAQCTIMFRQDGAMLLVSGAASGTPTILATYTGALNSPSVWYAFEIEVIIHNTTGSFTVRKNGNPVNDFQVTNLNTRVSTNNYANRIQIGAWQVVSSQTIDDFLWRSDPASVAWAGDLRCYTRRPSGDQSVTWTPSGGNAVITPIVSAPSPFSPAANNARYLPFTASYNGTISTAGLTVVTAFGVSTNVKAAIYNSSGVAPTTILATSNAVTAPGIGLLNFTFPLPPTVVQGQQYYLAICQDVSSGQLAYNSAAPPGFASLFGTTTYATFPVANPTSLSSAGTSNIWFTINITPSAGANAPMLCEFQEDGAATYVSSATLGAADLYNIAAISGTPQYIIAVVTRGYFQKTDAGTRNCAVQLKSGSVTVQSGSYALPSAVWNWITRVDTVDPNTGIAWNAVAVNNISIGPIVTA